jgi:hypothetical protein
LVEGGENTSLSQAEKQGESQIAEQNPFLTFGCLPNQSGNWCLATPSRQNPGCQSKYWPDASYDFTDQRVGS